MARDKPKSLEEPMPDGPVYWRYRYPEEAKKGKPGRRKLAVIRELVVEASSYFEARNEVSRRTGLDPMSIVLERVR